MGDQVVTYSEKALTARSRIKVVDRIPGSRDDQPGRPRHSPCLGQVRLHRHRSGLLIGVTLVMAGVYRGMVDDGKALLDNSGADLWVVQKDTLGPYAESSSLNDDVYRAILAMPGVAQAANVTYLTMQVRKGESRMCAPWWSASRPARWGPRPDGRLISSPGARSRAVTTRRWPTSPPASNWAIVLPFAAITTPSWG
jgi:hypothetical protein